MEDGTVRTADFYLLAVPQDVLSELLPADVVEREPAFSNLRNLRSQIDKLDLQLLKLVNDRASIAAEIGKLKNENGEEGRAPVLKGMLRHHSSGSSSAKSDRSQVLTLFFSFFCKYLGYASLLMRN